MSGNHNQSLDRALAIVEAAAKAGAHALKLQTYTPETLTLDLNEGDFHISDENSLWKGKNLFNLYKQDRTRRGKDKTRLCSRSCWSLSILLVK
jgi:N-acetylneuraminate synthase